MKKIPLCFFLLIRFAAGVSAQEEPALLVEPALPREGRNFTMSFLVPHGRAEEVQAASSEGFSPSTQLVAGPNISPLLVNDYGTGYPRPFSLLI